MNTAERQIFRVEGGVPLRGVIRPQGNKNEALPVLAASCLTEETVVLQNMPDIEDVQVMQRILREIGADVEEPLFQENPEVRVRARGMIRSDLPRTLSERLRGSVTLAGPLLARNGRVVLPRPGGDRIGRRRLDTHMLALQALGARLELCDTGFEITADRLVGADILLDEMSVTATENVVCAACLARGETVIRNAASEPHVQGLCRMLVGMGARIEGIGSNTLHIAGVDRLGGTTHRIGEDYLEVGSFMALAGVTGGELLIENAALPEMRMIRMVFQRFGLVGEVEGTALRIPAGQKLEVVSDLGGAIPHIDDAPWPGFPADMTSVALVLATQCHGTVLIHEKMFESRLFFVDRLIGMGARIVLCDPHRAVVIGPERLSGARLSSPDIRAGMALLIAALCAKGSSEIQNIIQIDRGFSRIDERLRAVGARIERADS
jgi:UDP-N-acetylglucosamine 1-carboxyvinyltransferase